MGSETQFFMKICGDVLTLRNDEHRTVTCVLPPDHRSAHRDTLFLSWRGQSATVWTDATHWDGMDDRG